MRRTAALVSAPCNPVLHSLSPRPRQPAPVVIYSYRPASLPLYCTSPCVYLSCPPPPPPVSLPPTLEACASVWGRAAGRERHGSSQHSRRTLFPLSCSHPVLSATQPCRQGLAMYRDESLDLSLGQPVKMPWAKQRRGRQQGSKRGRGRPAWSAGSTGACRMARLPQQQRLSCSAPAQPRCASSAGAAAAQPSGARSSTGAAPRRLPGSASSSVCARTPAQLSSAQLSCATSISTSSNVRLCTPTTLGEPAAEGRVGTDEGSWGQRWAAGRRAGSGCARAESRPRAAAQVQAGCMLLTTHAHTPPCGALTVGQHDVAAHRHAAVKAHAALHCQAAAVEEGGHRGRQRLQLVHQPAGLRECGSARCAGR